ncbi:MAG: hypothetical protein KDI56_16905 [Xanthomonadales bacterium]|nr:hypothetical protein [Xanthomonadales bacterium]MCB1626403.1 hypothetical protein [Xanthomonadales bacterium]
MAIGHGASALDRIVRSVVVLALAWILTACELETLESSWATRAEAVAAGGVEKGWIPDWVPAAAVNIREIHNLDSNEQSLRFELPDGSLLTLPSGCRAIDSSQMLGEHFQPHWWPSPSELASLYTIYHCPPLSTRTTHLAIARTGSPVLYWTRWPDST